MIFITGDVHGEYDLRKFGKEEFTIQSELTKKDYMIICGDFGFLWDESKTEKYWLRWLERKPWTTLWIDGNHENYNLLKRYKIEDWNGGQIQRWQADNCWTEENPNKWAAYPRIETLNMNNTNLQTSDYWLRNASFLRVKNVQIGYTLPKSVSKKAGMESVRIYLSGQNLFSFNSFYKGWDPENEIGTGDAPSYYPINAIYSFGLNLKF